MYVTGDDSYHTKQESFIRIKRLSNAAQGTNTKGEYWEVTAKDGTKYRFGYYDNSELLCEGSNQTFSVDRDYVLRWNLDQVEDTHDNRIFYTYQEQDGTAYLEKIEYNTPKERTILFNYTTNTFNQGVYYMGCKIKDTLRLSNIQVEVGTNLVRQYDMGFLNDDTRLPLLTSITEKGSDGTSTLPATTFTYKPQNRTFSTTRVKWVDHQPLDAQLESPDVRVSDVNGDGLLDIVRSHDLTGSNVTYDVSLNQGSTWPNTPEHWVNNADIDDGSFIALEMASFKELDVEKYFASGNINI